MATTKFTLLMWKSYRLRRHHWIITSIEFGLPLLIAYTIIKFIDSERNTPKMVMQNATVVVESKRKYIMYSALIVRLAYAPSDTFTDQLMGNVRAELLLEDEHLKKLANEEEVDYFLKSNTDSNWIGVVFYSSASDGKTPNKLNYALRNARIWNTGILYPSFRKVEPIKNEVDYINRGFAGVQIVVNEQFLQMKTNQTPWTTKELSVQPFPYPEYAKDISAESLPQELLSKENSSIIIGFVVVITVLISSVVLINDVMEEKETGVKELMKLTGVDEWLIWISWFLHAFVVSAISLTILTIILKYPFNGEASETIRVVKFPVLWLILIFYCVANISYCFMFCAIFHRAAIASSVFMISFAIIVFGITYLRIKNVSLVTKFSCVFPIGAFMQGFLRIRYFELSGTEFSWYSIISVENDVNGVSLLFVLLTLIFDTIFYFLLAFYITAINPGRFGARRSPLFILKPLFPNLQDTITPPYRNMEVKVDGTFLEPPPPHLEATIQIKHLYKHYGPIYAVNGVNLNIYKGEITALLGHNGAGKTTTMSILTGLTTPSAGSVLYKNTDLLKNMKVFRKNFGLCPQENRLLSYFSVMDHLLFFGMLKGIPEKHVVREANQYLRLMEMQSKRKSLVKELSGGMKRKLCLSISLMGKPGTLILDEPTSGMDVQSRRKIWDLLLDMRGDRIIILTTHFMEEADALGDRIAIMHEGIIVCHGTPIFLKKAYGTGYELTITKAYEDTGNLTRVIQTVLPDATKEHETRNHVVYKLPLTGTDKFPLLFRDLESFKSFLGIKNFGVACTTMEHVFLKVGGMSIYDSSQSPKSITVADATRDSRYLKTTAGLSLTVQQIMALFKKKYLYTKRNFLSLFTRIILPSLTLLLILRGFLGSAYSELEPSLDLSLKSYHNPIVMVDKKESDDEDFYHVYYEYAKEQGAHIINATGSGDIIGGLLDFGRQNITSYNRNLILAIELSTNTVKLLHNSWHLHSLPIAITTYSNALLRSITKNNSIEIKTYNYPVSVTRWRCGSMEAPEDFYPVWFFAMAFYTVDTITYFSGFINMERVDGFKHIQMMSNLSSHVYWIGTFIFDFIFFLIIITFRIILFKIFDDYFNFLAFDHSFEVLVLLIVAFGISGLLFVYVISFLSNSNEESYPVHFILNLMSALMVGVYYVYEVHFFSPDSEDFESSDYILLYYIAKYLILFTPPLNFCLLFIKFMFIWIFNSACEFCPATVKATCEDQKKKFSYWEYPSGENSNGLLLGLKFLFIDAILYAAILALINLQYVNYWFNVMKIRTFGSESTNQAEGDDDVRHEYDKVQNYKGDESNIGRVSLMVDGLRKNYIHSFRPFTAVTDVNFVVEPGECFGLLGVNGAGKTTTFKMLTAEILPTKGDAAIEGIKLSTNKTQYLSMTGYCAQTNSFIEELTGREMLTLIATLRGVTGKDIKVVVDRWISILGLKYHQNQNCGTYSGGNKRKLCTAMSLIGNPAVVFLDEPTSGVDPVSRRKLYDVMGQSKQSGQAVVLTSHSMEECESLCERLTIMTAGVMKCIGTPQHLKKRYAQGFSALIKINDDLNVGEKLRLLKNDMMNVFTPEYCVLKDEHRGLLYYQIKDTSLPWSVLFERLEAIKYRHRAVIDDYVLTDTTLEEVFISFAELDEMTPNS